MPNMLTTPREKCPECNSPLIFKQSAVNRSCAKCQHNWIIVLPKRTTTINITRTHPIIVRNPAGHPTFYIYKEDDELFLTFFEEKAKKHKNDIISWITQQLYLLAYPIDPDKPNLEKVWKCLSDVSLKINGDEFYP